VSERLELAAFDGVVRALESLRMAGVPILTFASIVASPLAKVAIEGTLAAICF
jgi:hypothetical protein